LFQQGIDSSMFEFEKTLDLAKKDLNNPELQIELNFRLGTLLHWIMSYWERARKSHQNIPDEVESFFSALCFANNQMKHEPTLTRFAQRTGGLCFPITFPLTIPAIRFIWHPDSSETNRYVNQRNNFKNYLENKEVMQTIMKAIEILKEYQLN